MTATRVCLCQRCAKLMPTCCQNSEIYVGPGDVDRIVKSIGRNDFFEYRHPSDPSYSPQPAEDPLWAALVFRPDGTRRVLKQSPSGDCIFLGQEGCILGVTIRPLICRLFPYEYTTSSISTQMSSRCPTALLEPGETLDQAIGLSWEETINWHRQLILEIHAETEAIAPRKEVFSIQCPSQNLVF